MSGLSREKVQAYWDKRAAKQGARTVGFSHGNTGLQDKRFAIRYEFVRPFLSPYVKTVDYGCGIGRWLPQFGFDYIGLDITKALLDIARERFPTFTFIHLQEPTLRGAGEKQALLKDMEQFFTATVLQHCDDELVRDIFSSVAALKGGGIKFVFYENSQVKSGHVNGRKPEVYVELLAEFYDVRDVQHATHKIHGEGHSVTWIET